MKKIYDAIVVGGGVNGAAIAFNLVKRGLKVLLLEKERLATKSSGAAAGMLGVQAELDKVDPLFQLARKSRDMFPQLAYELKEISGIDIELINKGMYKIAFSAEQESELKRIIDIQKSAGESAEWITGDEVRKSEPALSQEIIGAMFIPKDGQVSAPKLSLAFAKASATLGAEIKEFVEVQSFILHNGQIEGVITNEGDFYSENVIVANGAWSRKLLQETGIPFDVFPVKGECFSVLSHRPIIEKTVFSHGCYLVPKPQGRIIIGATVKTHTFCEKVTIDGIATLVERAKKIIPSIVEAEWERAWSGIRPQTGDGVPYLGKYPKWNGLYIATGHFRNGILLSPITGELMAELILGNQTPELEPFNIERRKTTIVSK